MNNWNIKSQNKIFQTKKIEIIRDYIVSPNNHSRYSTYINSYQDGICIIPYIISSDSFIIVKQYRHPIKQAIWQFPAGVNEKDSTPTITAKRELMEETGYLADKLVDIGSFFPDSELISNKGHFYIAIDPKLSIEHDSKNLIEHTEPKIITNSDLSNAILNGEIRDSWTLSGYLLFKLWQQKNRLV